MATYPATAEHDFAFFECAVCHLLMKDRRSTARSAPTDRG
jgi:hypothetical protein